MVAVEKVGTVERIQVEPLEDLTAISFLCRKIREMANENPTLSASFQIAAKHAGSVSLLLFLIGSCY